jgi:hypothetical protein
MTEMRGEGEGIHREGEDLHEAERGRGEDEQRASQLPRGEECLFICGLCNGADSDLMLRVSIEFPLQREMYNYLFLY